jgi:hypothetical protein
MISTRMALCAIASATALCSAVIGLGAPAERRIHVRWAEGATTVDRAHVEQELRLEAPVTREERTWSYELRDRSTANIARVVAHPLIEDTHHIDRDRLTLAPEFPSARAWVRRMYERRSLSTIAAWWHVFGPLLTVIAVLLALPNLRAAHQSDPTRVVLAGILVVAVLLRVVLIFSGGQFYWPDESRYQEIREAVAGLVAHDSTVAKKPFNEPVHVLFKVIAGVPAGIEFLRGDDARIAACFFALFSVVNIWLVVKIARRLDASATESLLAGTLFAASCSSFYYSRHLLPYDVAMTFGLLALYAGSARESTWRSSVACGIWAACAFLTYAGYWTLGGAACLIHVLDARSWRESARRAFVTGAGLASCVGVAILVYVIAAKRLVSSVVAFIATVTQGSHGEGWRLPLEYLWHAEHLLLVLWLGSLAWCIYNWRFSVRARRVKAALVGLAFVYGLLVVCSVVLNVFVVYGRLARQLVPFLCLLAAAVLMNVWAGRPELKRRAVALATLAVIIQAAINFRAPLTQQFPTEFKRRAEILAARAGASHPMTIYAQHFYGAPEPFTIPRGYTGIADAHHPLQFLPYQYEGLSPAERKALRSADIRMRLLIPANGRREAGGRE